MLGVGNFNEFQLGSIVGGCLLTTMAYLRISVNEILIIFIRKPFATGQHGMKVRPRHIQQGGL